MILTELIEEYPSLDEFLKVCCTGLTKVPLDLFSQVKYTKAHFSLAKALILEKYSDSNLIKWSIIWDLSHVISNYSKVTDKQTDIFTQLLSLMKLNEPSQADLTPILCLDRSDYTSEPMILALKESIADIGFFNLQGVVFHSIIMDYLNE